MAHTKEEYKNVAWVADEGSFGAGRLLTFDVDALTEQQWDNLSNLADYERLDYAKAILLGHPLNEWED